jgi:transposase, IS5 family
LFISTAMTRMTDQRGLFDVDGPSPELSARGDNPERVKAMVDFEIFRANLEPAVPRSDRARGGRPPYDHVLMFNILVLQPAHTLSDERT